MSIQTIPHEVTDTVSCDACAALFPDFIGRACAVTYDERRDGWFCDDCADCRETAEDHADNRRKAA